jgi:hypothetical protein
MNKSNDFINIDDKEVLEKIKNAYLKLLRNDSHLLEVDANERSITHRFAIYLEDEFPNHNVDCEYNRNGLETKRLNSLINLLKKEICSDDTNGVTVYPDIIIHRRGTNDDNFIVIEAKKTTTSDNGNDREKLKAYKGNLNYQYTFFVKFPVNKKNEVRELKECEEYIEKI